MDLSTLNAYDSKADAFAEDWETQPAPVDLQELLCHWFRPGPTADIGCGSGRDTAWLAANGFPAVGYDASPGLLAEARRRHPGLDFRLSPLPELPGVEEGSLTNVLCETVVMHLEPSSLAASLHRLLAVLAPGGTLFLSWRITEGADRRDDHGRLYAVVDAQAVRDCLAAAELLLDEESVNASSGARVHRIVARKRG
ncbi:class I SAM-dependent methyltransferase [Streptacidiphilus sp. 4-A2]|nr:class I SAM-dependent methyltransferase [Streptacidiphilus sp. 4-A2]